MSDLCFLCSSDWFKTLVNTSVSVYHWSCWSCGQPSARVSLQKRSRWRSCGWCYGWWWDGLLKVGPVSVITGLDKICLILESGAEAAAKKWRGLINIHASWLYARPEFSNVLINMQVPRELSFAAVPSIRTRTRLYHMVRPRCLNQLRRGHRAWPMFKLKVGRPWPPLPPLCRRPWYYTSSYICIHLMTLIWFWTR